MENTFRDQVLLKLRKQFNLKEEYSWKICIKHLREKFGITEEMPPHIQLKSLHVKLNLTLEILAGLLGTQEASTISRWEKQERIPEHKYRQKLFTMLGIPIDAWSAYDLSEKAQEFVSERALHRQEQSFPLVWNIPFRIPLFVGRQEVLQKLYDSFLGGKVESLTVAISGLGGIGKTYTALQYAYKNRSEYQAVWWVDASTRESLLAGLLQLARQIGKVPVSKVSDTQRMLKIVRQWMKDTTHWLLILDNVEDIDLIYDDEILPTSRRGHVLLTTRTQATGPSIINIELDDLAPEEGVLLLLKEAGRLRADEELKDANAQDHEHALTLSHLTNSLPLALVYAGAYIKEVQCGIAAYIQLYEKRTMDMLGWSSSTSVNKEYSYPRSVATTWSLSFDKVEQSSQAAVDLLRIYSFLAPDAIPEEIVIDGSAKLGSNLEHIQDEFTFNQVIAELRRYSLIHRNTNDRTVRIHRLVQFVFRDKMDVQTQYEWVEKTIEAVYLAITAKREVESLLDFDRFVNQLQACAELIGNWRLASEEVVNLLHFTGNYFYERAWYDLAEKYLQQGNRICTTVFKTDSDMMIPFLNGLEKVYLSQGKYEQAEEKIKQLLTINEMVWGSQHYNVASCFHELAHLSKLQGQYEKAELYYKQALNMRLSVLEHDNPAIAISLNGLATFYQEQHRFAEAEQLHIQALDIRKKQLHPQDPELASSYYNLAVNYAYQRKYEEAKPLCVQALNIFEKVMGKEHPLVAQVLNVQAEIAHSQGEYEKAESLFHQALRIREKLLGDAHPDVAQSLTNIGALCQSQGKYEAAEEYYKKALTIIENALGTMHPHVVLVLANYISLLRKVGRENEAQAMSRRIQAILEVGTE